MPTSEDAAAAAAAQVISNEAQATESGSETEETTESTTEEFVFPSFDIDLPPELRAELEEEDVTEESITEDEIEALSERYENADEDVLRRLAAAEKKAKHFEDLRVNEARKNWAEEAKKFFPFSEPFLDEIQATSKRGYLRTAKNVHERMAPLVEEKVLKPAREAMEKAKTEVVTETKEEVKKSWGEPVTEDETRTPPASVEAAQARRKRGDFADTVRSMIFNKES